MLYVSIAFKFTSDLSTLENVNEPLEEVTGILYDEFPGTSLILYYKKSFSNTPSDAGVFTRESSFYLYRLLQ